jgi:hypothetical protein
VLLRRGVRAAHFRWFISRSCLILHCPCKTAKDEIVRDTCPCLACQLAAVVVYPMAQRLTMLLSGLETMLQRHDLERQAALSRLEAATAELHEQRVLAMSRPPAQRVLSGTASPSAVRPKASSPRGGPQAAAVPTRADDGSRADPLNIAQKLRDAKARLATMQTSGGKKKQYTSQQKKRSRRK